MLLSLIKQFIYRPFALYKIRRNFKYLKNAENSSPRLYLLNVPSHGNLGDHLLSVAEQKFFKDFYPKFSVVLVTSADLYYSVHLSLESIRPQDILCITGGGFLGSLYDEEKRFLKILKRFPNNKILVLPQTIYYEKNLKGFMALKKAKKAYAKHKNLYIVARDLNTFDLLQNELMKEKVNHIALTPDLALYLKFDDITADRKKVLWCMREDLEVNPNNHVIISELKAQLSSIEIGEEYTDTYVPYSIPLEREEEEVSKKIKQISHASLVITDRLHGMIFSVITGTPVIVMDNVNGKVGQVYKQWLSDVPYIRFVTNKIDVENLITEMLGEKRYYYNNEILKQKYYPIINFINATN